MASIWVFVREADGAPSSIGLELVTKARDLGDVTVVYVGAGSDGASPSSANSGRSESSTSIPVTTWPALPWPGPCPSGYRAIHPI